MFKEKISNCGKFIIQELNNSFCIIQRYPHERLEATDSFHNGRPLLKKISCIVHRTVTVKKVQNNGDYKIDKGVRRVEEDEALMIGKYCLENSTYHVHIYKANEEEEMTDEVMYPYTEEELNFCSRFL